MRGTRRTLTCALLIAGCQRTPAPPSPDAGSAVAPSASSEREAALLRALQGGDASTVAPLLPEWGARARACKTDSECVISSRVDGRCCDNLCDPQEAYSREFDRALAHQRERCNPDLCPAKSCLPLRVRRVARCDNGRCDVETRDLDGGIRKRAGEPPCGCAPGDPLCECR